MALAAATACLVALPPSAGATIVRRLAQLPSDAPVLIGGFANEQRLLVSDQTYFSTSVDVSSLDVATGAAQQLFTARGGVSPKRIIPSANGAFVASYAASGCVGRRSLGNGGVFVNLWPTTPGAQATQIKLPPGYKTSDASVVSVSALGRVTIFTGDPPSCGGKSAVLSAAPGTSTFKVVALGNLPGSVVQTPCGCGGTLSYNTLTTAVSPNHRVFALCRAYATRPGVNQHRARLTVVDSTSDLTVYAQTVRYQNTGAPSPDCMASDQGYGAIYALVSAQKSGASKSDGAVVGPGAPRPYSLNAPPAAWGFPLLRPSGTDLIFHDGQSGVRFLDVNVRTGRQRQLALPDALRRAGYNAGCGGAITWSPFSNTVLFEFCSPTGRPYAYTALSLNTRRWSTIFAPAGALAWPCFLPSGQTLLSIPSVHGLVRSPKMYISDAGRSFRQVANRGLLPAVDVDNNETLPVSHSQSCAQSDGTILLRGGQTVFVAQASQLDGSPLVIAP